MTEENSNNLELFHYGVKGMKWGVRRERDSSTGRVGKLRQKIRDRDDAIKKSRDELPGAYIKEARATVKSAKSKVGVVRNIRDKDARTSAKTASQERRAASRERAEIERSANRKTSKEIAIKGAVYAIPALAGTATLAVSTAATRKNARIGKEFAAAAFSDTNGLPAPGTIALQFIDGVWQ